MMRMGARWAAVVLIASGVGAAACGDTTGPTTPIGHYTLASVNGVNVPSTMFEDGAYKLEVTGGTLEMEADSTYVAAIVSLETVDVNESEYVDSLRGRWSQDQATGTMQFTLDDDAYTFTGAWQGRRITVFLASGLFSSSMLFEKPR